MSNDVMEPEELVNVIDDLKAYRQGVMACESRLRTHIAFSDEETWMSTPDGNGGRILKMPEVGWRICDAHKHLLKPKRGRNPISLCVYDWVDDPLHDCCMYCGKPEERK